MTYQLSAMLRVKKPETVRAEHGIPAEVYGVTKENQSLVLPYNEFFKIYKDASESSLLDLTVDGKDAGKVLVQELQFEPVSGKITHVDLRRIDMKKELTVFVELKFVGESPIVKSSGGTLVKNLDRVEVKCLPNDLVEYVEVDLSVLKTFEDSIRVKDLKAPAGVVVTRPQGESVIATAKPALTEDQIKAMEEASKTADISKIEVAGKKEEPVEGEEGAEAKDGEKKEDKKDGDKGDKKEEKK
ncbi:MAG: hypothetical protein A3J93_01775 [Candidatus Magasanikbacteria bacterium RIFOXYC2_FULL_42_28]|uniref:Large ribosomal subunit protein bL25 n=1 Tax=Candidatus Magasanikbacteria bacterium RIFOXYC2_FULL_42_28 TaxID=1798704 RepID=A0A1F6NY44_9BACT|nr:MAG: hypothetical protein A3J93_01775 [Candidatus Magasanikbacteria bacterium RIFOXYC2_FULL_42_28]